MHVLFNGHKKMLYMLKFFRNIFIDILCKKKMMRSMNLARVNF